jgi:hypothetical protein
VPFSLHHPLLPEALSAAALLDGCLLHLVSFLYECFVAVMPGCMPSITPCWLEHYQQQHCLLLECLLHVFLSLIMVALLQ